MRLSQAARSAVAAALSGGSLATRWRSSDGFAICSGQREGATRSAVFGRIDNRDWALRALGLPPGSPAGALYDAALAHWGDDTDNRLIGHYCAATVRDDGSLRLVRSPWTAPPLHFVASGSSLQASPLLVALFAAGHPAEIDYDHLVDQLAYDHRDGEPVGWFKGVGRVPLGTRLTVGCGKTRMERYYDPLAIPTVRFAKDADYVEAAWGHLEGGATAALDGVARPGMMLSGGLDSPLAAIAVLRRLPEAQALPCFTFHPHRSWDGVVPPNLMGDERDLVRDFAAQHPRIEAHFTDPDKGGHDYRLRELLRHSGSPSANIANVGIFHGPLEAARSHGCDAMLTAMLGNFTISNAAPWAPPEFFRVGKWRELAKLFAARASFDSRPRMRMLAAMALLPQLPGPLQGWLRRRFGARPVDDSLVSLLTPEALARQDGRRRARGGLPRMASRSSIPANRAQAISAMWLSADSGEDLDLGLARLYGMEFRDVTAHRPLVEYCHGLPTEQFVRDGQDRWLARRMADGYLPTRQRDNQRTGRHNVDWHARLSSRRDELIAYAHALAAHPVLGEVLDIARMQRLLADWPERTPWEPEEAWPRHIGLTRSLTAAHFVSLVEGRNDF